MAGLLISKTIGINPDGKFRALISGAHVRFLFQLCAGVLIVFGLFVSPLIAVSYREIGDPPTQVYKTMLSSVERGELEKVSASLQILAPISLHIQSRFRIDPNQPVLDFVQIGDRQGVLKAVNRYIALDINNLLKAAIDEDQTSRNQSRADVKEARINYELLANEVVERDFETDKRIKNDFSNVYRFLSDGSIYSREDVGSDLSQLRSIVDQIMTSLARLFIEQSGQF
jgi:hypothetical protein